MKIRIEDGITIIESSEEMRRLEKLKQESWDRDEADLAAGRISAKELNNRNGLLAGIDFSKVIIGGRRP